MKKIGLVAAGFILLFNSSVSWSNDIPFMYDSVARRVGVPSHIFFCMALTESGVMLKSGKYLPWPWTLNIKGKSYRFSTRIEAYQAIQRFLVLTELIDIGLVQANWRWQKQRFSDTWEALDPEVNLRVAATIFKEQYLISNDWWKAVGQYHAPNNAKNAEKYRKAVYKHCQNAGLIS